MGAVYKPLPRVLGKSVAIPSDIAELCRPGNIVSTLRNLSSGPRTSYEGRPDSTPQAGYGGLTTVAAVRQDLRNEQWDMWTVRTAYQGLALEVKTDPQFRERLSSPRETNAQFAARTEAELDRRCKAWLDYKLAIAHAAGAEETRRLLPAETEAENFLRLKAQTFLQHWISVNLASLNQATIYQIWHA